MSRRGLRRQLGDATLKAHAFDVLSAALLGKPQNLGAEVDIAWLLEKRAEELMPKPTNPVVVVTESHEV